MKKYKIGYTQGVFDMFHVGHLNLINTAKQYCDYLIVAVNIDELVQSYKHKTPVINQEDRRVIVGNLKSVDKAIVATTLNKVDILQNLPYNAIFIGDDWQSNDRWMQTKDELSKFDVDVVFLPYTKNVSSTLLRNVENLKVEE